VGFASLHSRQNAQAANEAPPREPLLWPKVTFGRARSARGPHEAPASDRGFVHASFQKRLSSAEAAKCRLLRGASGGERAAGSHPPVATEGSHASAATEGRHPSASASPSDWSLNDAVLGWLTEMSQRRGAAGLVPREMGPVEDAVAKIARGERMVIVARLNIGDEGATAIWNVYLPIVAAQWRVGSFVGLLDGLLDGFRVGLTVGVLDELADGLRVGANDGDEEGLLHGLCAKHVWFCARETRRACRWCRVCRGFGG